MPSTTPLSRRWTRITLVVSNPNVTATITLAVTTATSPTVMTAIHMPHGVLAEAVRLNHNTLRVGISGYRLFLYVVAFRER